MNSGTDTLAAERVGSVLNGKWTLERLVGIGGMAAVYAARHRNGARAAVKVLHTHLARHEQVRERFQREGYAANKVGHPGVVKVLDDEVVSEGADAGTTYLVMELLEGESLQDRLERGDVFGERDFLHLATQVLEVLEAAHDQGVVHRDLKPENLFLARDGTAAGKTRVKVLDFGLARLVDSQVITTYGLALGTPSFMSPEQAAGRIDEIDGRTDLFALAATGFRLRTGRRIHEADNPVELVTMMSRLPAPRIRTVMADVSPTFSRVIDRGLEFRREDRYESALAMRQDVQRALQELGGDGPRAVVPPAVGPSASARRPTKARPPPARRDPTIEVSERDLERPQAFGIDESIRLPKSTSIFGWLALLLVAAAAVALWYEVAHSDAVLATLDRWRVWLTGPAASSVAEPSVNSGTGLSARADRDAGSARPTSMPAPGAGTYRSTPVKSASSAPRPPRVPPPPPLPPQ